MPDNLFTARATGDGTDTVTVVIDGATALQLAAAWDHIHVTEDVNAILNPLWWWDVAELRRAAADAIVTADAAAQYRPAETTRAHLRLVATTEVKTS